MMTVASLCLSIVALLLAAWSILLGLRGEKLLDATKAITTRLTLLSRIERLTALGRAVTAWQEFETAQTGGPDLRRGTILVDLLGAANACDSDMDLPATRALIEGLKEAGGAGVGHAPPSPEMTEKMGAVQREVLDRLALLWKRLNPSGDEVPHG